ncbi:MAG: PIG-L family deacetylase, partial [Pseudomonadota bacterium]|nr:PIG-L family deacetylase [Pseudomonadota bacterium]
MPLNRNSRHSVVATVGKSEAGENFLAELAYAARNRLTVRLAVVVAHPDDETIGCGSLLARSNDVTVMHVTDGAPRNLLDAQKLGFGNAEAYAQARRGELEAAMALAGLPADRLIWLGWSDQEASLHLVDIAHDLSRRLSGTDIVLTHAFEGGHPDHDATAFATHAAAALLRSRGEPPPEIIEFPLYRAGPEGWIAQSFSSEPQAGELAFELLTDERA